VLEVVIVIVVVVGRFESMLAGIWRYEPLG
jgi:hypothetical protein